MIPSRRLAAVVIVFIALAAAPSLALAQGTQADYDRALKLRERFDAKKVTGTPDAPVWIGETGRFHYRVITQAGQDFVLVDAKTGERKPAFDHDRIAAALSALTGEKYTGAALPFNNFRFVDGERSIEMTVDGGVYRCAVADSTCRKMEGQTGGRGRGAGPGRGGGAGPDGAPNAPRTSPDGKWEALIINYNVHVRAPGSRETIALSRDGSEGGAYELRMIEWSPDSKKLAAYRVTPGFRRYVHYVESSPEDQLQPKHSTRLYAKPGDVLDVEQPVIFDVASKTQRIVDRALFPNAYDVSRLVWRKDSRAVTFEYNERGHQLYRVIEIDAANGTPRVVLEEKPQTFFNYSGKKYRYDVDDGESVIWMSERDGWNHLYLIDGKTGQVRNQITKGDWAVRSVVEVDEAKKQIWFSATGKNPDQDPYFVHFYRINFDGTGLHAFTTANGTHTVTFTPDMEQFVDLYSRVDMAPVSELRRSADNSLIATLGTGDLSALKKEGWTAPEVFVSKGRDGKTDIWGVIYRPTNFDPRKKYPVIENIYAGPQGSFVPKAFGANNAMRGQAELGFIVVQIDGMGTSNRSKAFHDVAWRNLGDAGFPDRIRWHKAVGAKYPWYDITRVGIYGTSAGGQNSLGGLLFHPDFYDAAVSAVGCHDNRMDKIWWNEQWMGWPLGTHYEDSSNVVHAGKLQGKLLLVVGELDTNVDPASTLQVASALIKANKDFDLLFIPGAGHGPGGAYGERRRFDFFVRHLLGVQPPDWNAKTVTTSTSPQGDQDYE
ncbi:MAG: DPP IV N-terminal domain-containing protein [Vicinamibacterales bacterium]